LREDGRKLKPIRGAEKNMQRMNQSLWAAALYTGNGALLFLLPEIGMGRLLHMPTSVPMLYSLLVAYILLVFTIIYFWQASKTNIDPAILFFCALGKAGAFVIAMTLWLTNHIAGTVFAAMFLDGVFAAYWLLYLWQHRRSKH